MSKIEPGTPQWEDICTKCGLCCLIKYIDISSGKVFLTDIRCEMLNTDGSCECYSSSAKERNKGKYNCIENGGSPLNWDTLFNDYIQPGCCAYVQKFGNPKLVSKCRKRPDIDLTKTGKESDFPREEYEKHVIPGSDTYFRYNPEVNKRLRKIWAILGKTK